MIFSCNNRGASATTAGMGKSVFPGIFIAMAGLLKQLCGPGVPRQCPLGAMSDLQSSAMCEHMNGVYVGCVWEHAPQRTVKIRGI